MTGYAIPKFISPAGPLLRAFPLPPGAYVPDLPGLISVGDSRDEVERLIQEGIGFHLEGMREEGLAIPAPSSFAGVIEIDPAA